MQTRDKILFFLACSAALIGCLVAMFIGLQRLNQAHSTPASRVTLQPFANGNIPALGVLVCVQAGWSDRVTLAQMFGCAWYRNLTEHRCVDSWRVVDAPLIGGVFRCYARNLPPFSVKQIGGILNNTVVLRFNLSVPAFQGYRITYLMGLYTLEGLQPGYATNTCCCSDWCAAQTWNSSENCDTRPAGMVVAVFQRYVLVF